MIYQQNVRVNSDVGGLESTNSNNWYNYWYNYCYTFVIVTVIHLLLLLLYIRIYVFKHLLLS